MEPIDNGFANQGIFKQYKPLRLNLRSENEWSLRSSTADVIEAAASGLGGLDFFEQEVDREKLCRMTFLVEPFTQSDGEMSFAQLCRVCTAR